MAVTFENRPVDTRAAYGTEELLQDLYKEGNYTLEEAHEKLLDRFDEDRDGQITTADTDLRKTRGVKISPKMHQAAWRLSSDLRRLLSIKNKTAKFNFDAPYQIRFRINESDCFEKQSNSLDIKTKTSPDESKLSALAKHMAPSMDVEPYSIYGSGIHHSFSGIGTLTLEQGETSFQAYVLVGDDGKITVYDEGIALFLMELGIVEKKGDGYYLNEPIKNSLQLRPVKPYLDQMLEKYRKVKGIKDA